jgi:hypothetical protein
VRSKDHCSYSNVFTAGLCRVCGISSVNSQAAGYTYTKVAVLGETAPGGAQYINDFEPGQINNRGDVIYVADLSTAGTAGGFTGEGVFLLSKGQIFGLAADTRKCDRQFHTDWNQ